MRILIFNWRDIKHPKAGGAEISTYEHAKAWVKAGHQVTQFSSSFLGAKKLEVIDGVKIIRAGREFLSVHLLAFLYYLLKWRSEVDLIVDQFHGIPFFTPLYSKKKKLAFIHEVAKEVWFLNYPWLLGLIGFLTEPWVFRIFYKTVPFLTVSESTKNDLIKWGVPAKNITIIHNGVGNINIKNFKKEKLKTVVFLGNLSRDKGVEDAILAFSEIEKREKDWQFWVIGRGENRYLGKLKKLAGKLQIAKKVKFWGYVSEEKKFELLAKAHILINPSIREGWGLVNIEANSMGTPVVALKSPGLVDSVQNGLSGLIVNKNTPDELASKISALLKDREKYSQLSKGAKNWARQFSWQKSTQNSLKLIASFNMDKIG